MVPTGTAAMGHAVVLSLDTLGDQVLRQSLFRPLLDEGWTVTAVVSRPFAPLLPLIDPRLRVVGTEVRPQGYPGPDSWAQLSELEASIRSLGAIDVVVDAVADRTWADEYLMRRFNDVRRLGFATEVPPIYDLERLAPVSVGVPSVPWVGAVRVDDADHESTRQRRLCEALVGHTLPEVDPVIDVPEATRREGRRVLSSLGLRPGEFAAGCPAGTANQPLKAWPAERFATVVAHLEHTHASKVLLLGSDAERDALEEVRTRAGSLGASPAVWTGGPAELPILVALLAESRLYVGNDTGPMHVAAAVGVPVVVRFSGAHWAIGAPGPRFAPLARRAVVLTRGLACFGCGWECWLDHAACMSMVTDENVIDGIAWALSEGPPQRRVEMGAPLSEEADLILRHGLRARQTVDRDREARLAQVDQLTASLAEVEADRAARLEQILTLTATVRQLESRLMELRRALPVRLSRRLGLIRERQ
jgi:ADP-heptose:LPS heptosyltransferase